MKTPTTDVELPPLFATARELITAALQRSERAAVPSETLTAVLLVELMPRLVGNYGHERAADMLSRLAREVLADRDDQPICKLMQ
ncbi:hypothetical protein [Dongia mobilis]|jgi:hypothetical protein|uniref:hypothetical protein n=1 Tax=Dongia sp. TaxID=1977262 RepID=UPI0026F35418